MLPNFPICDHSYKLAANAKPFGNNAVIATTVAAEIPDHKHFIRCEFGASNSGGAILLNHVRRIILISTFKQVGRITTGLPIAGMANKKISPFTRAKKVSQSVNAVASFLSTKSSVPICGFALRPSPAFSSGALPKSFVYVVPEAFNFLWSKLRRGYIRLSHVSLLERLMRSGSLERRNLPCGPFAFYHALEVIIYG